MKRLFIFLIAALCLSAQAQNRISDSPRLSAIVNDTLFMVLDQQDGTPNLNLITWQNFRTQVQTELQGSPGVAGADGKTLLSGVGAPNGAVGTDGDFYIDNFAYRIYGPKSLGAWDAGVDIIGATGATGPPGLDGNDGTDGNRLLSGFGVPGSGTGSDGDFYIDQTSSEIYGPKVGLDWGSATSIVGDTGSQGSTGPQGATGATGAAGSDGTNGVDGVDGLAATISVGVVTTGSAGSSASVINTGNSSAATFDFVIPRGDTGAQGIQGIQGDPGNDGADGSNGTNGVGVPVGGTTAQVLAKIDGTDYNTHWVTAALGGGDLWSDPVDANIVPDVGGSRFIGTTLLRFDTIYSIDMNLIGDVTTTGLFDGRNVSVDGAAQDAHIADSTIHYLQTQIDYNNLMNLPTIPSGNGILDWTLASQGTIHATNYVDNNTQNDQAAIEAFGFTTGPHVTNNASLINGAGYFFASAQVLHNSTTGYLANQHIDWTTDQGATNIDAGNYVDNDTVYDDTAIQAEVDLNTAKVTNATHTGDVTGSTALTIAVDAVDIPMLSATGTADNTTFLRGDNTWSVPAGGSADGNGVYDGSGTISGDTTVNITSSFDFIIRNGANLLRVDGNADYVMIANDSNNVRADGDGIQLNFGATNDLVVEGDPGTSGQVLTSNGNNLPPSWETPSGGGSAPSLSKTFSAIDVSDENDVFMWQTKVAITVTEVDHLIVGSTNVVWNVQFASTANGARTDVFTSDVTTTLAAGDSANSGFNDATIPADSWIFFETVSVSGTPTGFGASVNYTED